MNFKISSKKYHYLTKEGIRKGKRRKWTRQFVAFEENDRNDRTKYAQMPSPKGANWRDYIRHRLTIMSKAIEVHTTENYTRLRFDKYIESNRVCDKIAAMLVRINSSVYLLINLNIRLRKKNTYVILQQTNGKPCIIYMGGVDMSPNSPIKIKKHIRAPGNRKILKSFKKLRCNVVRKVNEDRTSRLCGRCYDPFPLSTLGHRFKKCEWCLPNPNDWPDTLKLPEKIVTMKSRRMYKRQRKHSVRLCVKIQVKLLVLCLR